MAFRLPVLRPAPGFEDYFQNMGPAAQTESGIPDFQPTQPLDMPAMGGAPGGPTSYPQGDYSAGTGDTYGSAGQPQPGFTPSYPMGIPSSPAISSGYQPDTGYLPDRLVDHSEPLPDFLQAPTDAFSGAVQAGGDILGGLGESMLTKPWETGAYSHLGETGGDFGKAIESAYQAGAADQAARETQMLTDPAGAIINAAMSYPGANALEQIPSKAAISAMSRAGGARIGEAWEASQPFSAQLGIKAGRNPLSRGFAEGVPEALAPEVKGPALFSLEDARALGEQEGLGQLKALQQGLPEGLPETAIPTKEPARVPFKALTTEEQLAQGFAESAPDVLQAPDLTPGQQLPRPKRTPLWAIGEDAPAPPTPPTPPTVAGSAPELPSGRKPGGIQNMVTPQETTDDLARMREALTPEQKGAWQSIVEAKDKFLRGFYDKNAPLAKLQKQTDLPVHDLAQVVPGARAYGEVIIQKFFEPVLAPLGKDIDKLEEYMNILRSYDLRARNTEALLPGGTRSPGDALAAFKAEIGPERFAAVEKASQVLWGAPGKPQDGLLYQHVLKPLVDEGILDAKAVQQMQAANPHYIDWHRLDAVLENPYKRSPQTASLSTTGIGKLELAGSTRKLDEPLARTLAQAITVQERVARNKAARYLYGALEQIGEAKPHTGTALPGEGKGVISFFRDGKEVTVEVPELYAEVAKGLEAETAGIVGRILQAIAAPLRAGATSYNPAFVLINPIRDFTTAGFQTGWKTVLSPEYIKGWAAAFTHNADYFDAAKDGALMGGLIDGFTKTADLSRIAGRRIVGIPLDTAGDVAKFIPRLIRETNNASERATRIGVYLKSKDEGMAGLQAAIRARDATVDFSKSGNVVKVLNQAIPFLNAGVQGTSNMARVIKNNPKGAIAAAAPLAALSVLADYSNSQFASSDLIPEYERKANWTFTVGESTTNPDVKTGESTTYPIYVKIPKGPLAAVITAPVELAIRLLHAKGGSWGEELASAAGGITESLSPVSLSPSSLMLPGFGTAAAMAANKDFFTGREIVPSKEQNRPANLQYGPETSRQAVLLGQLTGKSPRMIDYPAKNYVAGTGQAASFVLDKALQAVGYNPEIPGEAKNQRYTGTEQLSRVPVVSRFLGVKNTEQERNDYEALRKVTDTTREKLAKEYPSSVRLGINLGQVGDSIGLNGATLYLTPKEQAQMQEQGYLNAKPILDGFMDGRKNPARYQQFKAQSPQVQTKMMQDALSAGREQARGELLKSLGNDEIKRRINLSMQVPMKLAAGGR